MNWQETCLSAKYATAHAWGVGQKLGHITYTSWIVVKTAHFLVEKLILAATLERYGLPSDVLTPTTQIDCQPSQNLLCHLFFLL